MLIDKRVDANLLSRQLGERVIGSRTVVSELSSRIRELIVDGRLPLNTMLPPERRLAEALGVSRTTVAALYERLRQAGYVESKRGSGSWVTLPPTTDDRQGVPWLPGRGTPSTVDLAYAGPAAPREALMLAAQQATEMYPDYMLDHGYRLHGIEPLRIEIARRFEERGLPTTADEILVVSGAQQALNLVVETFVPRGGRVLVDHPTYPGMLDLLKRNGARAIPIGFEGDVWHLESLRHAARDAAPHLMYMVADAHNPTGLNCPSPVRQEIVDALARAGIPLVVDETLVELRHAGQEPLPPMASLGRFGGSTVISVGSMSKSFWGGIRVGWLRGPAAIVRQLASARAIMDMGGAVFDQLTALELLINHTQVLDRRRVELAHRRDHLMSELGNRLPGWKPIESQGGLNLWVDLGRPVSGELVRRAAASGVQLTPGSRFGVDGAFESFIRIPFSLPPSDLEWGISQLSKAWGQLRV